jgi:hypothetical protein
MTCSALPGEEGPEKEGIASRREKVHYFRLQPRLARGSLFLTQG